MKTTTKTESKSKKPLPKFDFETLDSDNLGKVTGGRIAQCTAGTRSVCHVDGTDDQN